MVRPYRLVGILMFHLRYINIPKQGMHHTSTGGRQDMNANSKREFGLALVSFAIGAALAGILGNSKARAKLLEESKKLAENFRSTE
jgi:hypothetical protein